MVFAHQDRIAHPEIGPLLINRHVPMGTGLVILAFPVVIMVKKPQAPNTDPGGLTGLATRFQMSQCADKRFCCLSPGSDKCDCSGTNLFDLGAGTFITTLPLSTMLSTSTSLPASMSTSTTSTEPSTSVPPPNESSNESSNEPSPQSSNNHVAIGAGVGAGVGVPLLAAVAVLAWYLHKRQKARDAATHQGAVGIEECKEPPKVIAAQRSYVNELPGENRYELNGTTA
ncbi:hypothetical protein OPT61_g6721 [Boeremia exigua]|uniref:Uncharacterized protein n=1 Tax=Boeremia exigua TaxID=749465 RepID=A0ACC2I518_9PLEO|nr:hypothetical protein OPT61_g6721 [Boeremia exigua]